MNDDKLLSLLVCPENHSRLHPADEQLLTRLNRAIAAGRVKNRAGKPVEQPLAAGLIRAEGDLLYPVIDGIPVLLIDEGLPLEQLE
jgi:uncharacterized protein YbaR (Trm112 family)